MQSILSTSKPKKGLWGIQRLLIVVFFMYLPSIVLASPQRSDNSLIAERAQEFKEVIRHLASKGIQTVGYKAFEIQVISGQLISSEAQIFKAADNPILQAFLDKMILDILTKSESSRNLCALSSQDEVSLAEAFGISQAAAKSMQSICSAKKSDNPKNNLRAPKNIYWVFDIPEDFPIDSWTSASNDLFIFFPEVPSMESLYARLVHEFYIANDVKMMLGRDTFLNLVEQTGFKAQSNSAASVSTEARDALGIYPMPLIKFSFAALRSLIFEKVILTQMFGEGIDKKISDFSLLKLPGDQALLAIIQSLKPLQDFLLPHESWTLRPDARKQYYTSLGYYLDDQVAIERLVQKIKTTRITLVDQFNHNKNSLFEWLTQPVMDQSQIFARGPKPRIGGGFLIAQDKKEAPKTEQDLKIEVVKKPSAEEKRETNVKNPTIQVKDRR